MILSLDNKTKSAVLMQLQVIGEMSKKIPEETKENIPVPWKKISGLRDMVSHDYFSLDMPAIWKTITENVPQAETEIKGYLEDLTKE